MLRDYFFSEKDIELFENLIPDYYYNPLREGKILGMVVIDDQDELTLVVGVVLFRITMGYIEVLWVATTEEFDLPDYGADMVRILLGKARISGGFHGVYARFRKGSPMLEYFPRDEFVLSKDERGVYRFRLGDVTLLDRSHDSKKGYHCIALKDADEHLRKSLIADGARAHEPIPMDSNIKWEAYDQEMSFIYRTSDDEAEGAILVEDNFDELVVSLLFAKDPLSAVVLLKHAFHVAYEKYGDDCKVDCPVINGLSEGLVKKIVRKYDHVEMIRAQAYLPVGTGTLADFLHYSEHKIGHVSGNGAAR